MKTANFRENISPGETRKKSVQFKDEEIRNEFDHINDGVLKSPAVGSRTILLKMC